MRIHFINRFFFPDHSATSQILTDLAFHLAQKGDTVSVITSRLFYEDPTAILPSSEYINGVHVRRIATTRFGRDRLLGRALDYVSFHFSAGWAAWRTVRRGDILVAKTDPPLISVVAMAVARLRGARLVNWIQDVFPEVATTLGVGIGQGLLGTVSAAMRDASLRAARCNVVLGERMADLLVQRGIARERIVTIPNWADDVVIVPIISAVNELAADWGLTGKFVVGYSGNLGRVHEFGTILDAARILKDDSRIVFLFVGSGAQSEAVKREVAERNLRNFVFRPYQPRERLSWSLGASNLHLVSLRPDMEGLIVPSKFYGVAAAGRPVAFVGDKNGEIAQIVRRHDCGASFAVGDAGGLASYIRKLADEPEEAARLGTNARAALDANYSQAKAMQKWEIMLSTIA